MTAVVHGRERAALRESAPTPFRAGVGVGARPTVLAPGGRASGTAAVTVARLGSILRFAGPPLLSVALIALAIPMMLRVEWREVATVLGSISPVTFVGLGGLWLLGLWVHTIALSAALPGLSHNRALILNLSGSAVSNLIPLGGAAGTIANAAMAKTWGVGGAAFARWAVVTNVWDTALKLALPLAALGWLGVANSQDGAALHGAALWAAIALAILAAAAYALGRSDAAVRRIGSGLDALARAARRPCTSSGGYAALAVTMRRDSASLIRAAWMRLTVGKVAYAVLQAALLGASLWVVGAQASAAVVFAAFAVERVVSVLVITPGATGFTEIGVAGALVAMGVDPVPAAAGVVLYRFFTFVMEIPVGGAMLIGWQLRRRMVG